MTSPRHRVLVTCPQMQAVLPEFSEQFDAADIEVVAPEVVQQLSEDELASMIPEFDGIIAGDDPLTAHVLERASRLRVISKWGVGTDGIDNEAADRLDIRVTNTPGVFGEEVADVAFGYIILLSRWLHRMDASVREGGWLKVEGRSISGKTIGVVGFGDIGKSVVRRAFGFGMSVLVYDVSQEAVGHASTMGADPRPLDSVLSRADFVVLCCPLTPQTHHLIDDQALRLMRPEAYLVNVARGPLVDERALVDALETRRIAGAALDVFEEEPLPPGSRLREFERCVFGSHNGSNTKEAVLRASRVAVEHLLDELA